MPKRAGFFVFGGWPLAFGRLQPRFSLRFLPHLFAASCRVFSLCFLLHLFAASSAASFCCASYRIFLLRFLPRFSLCFLPHLFPARSAVFYHGFPGVGGNPILSVRTRIRSGRSQEPFIRTLGR